MSNTAVAYPEVLSRLQKDVRSVSVLLSRQEARYLVDAYYQIQDHRIEAQGQARSLTKSEEPNELIAWLFGQHAQLEGEIAKCLDDFSNQHVPGVWAKTICGIGPIIAAGLLAHIDIERSPTVGHIWSFAGLDPTKKWLPKTKRPWNASLKVLCWKIGQSFVKVQNNDNDIYGKVYATRKLQEIERNQAGLFSDQADAKLAQYNIGKSTDAYLWYSGSLTADHAREILLLPATGREGAARKMAGEPGSGVPMLPPAHIHSRSTRYATKLFLAHYHHVAYENHFGTPPPKPYIIEHGGHVHYLAPPNWPMGANL